MVLTPFLDLDQAYTTWLELRNVRYPWNESMDCWVEYVMSESWRHGDCHRHSMACGDGRRCRTAALVAIDAVLYWQEKHEKPREAQAAPVVSSVREAALAAAGEYIKKRGESLEIIHAAPGTAFRHALALAIFIDGYEAALAAPVQAEPGQREA